jgi:hypothetical protein
LFSTTIGYHAGDDVGGAAGRKRHHEFYRLVGVALRQRGTGTQRETTGGEPASEEGGMLQDGLLGVDLR